MQEAVLVQVIVLFEKIRHLGKDTGSVFRVNPICPEFWVTREFTRLIPELSLDVLPDEGSRVGSCWLSPVDHCRARGQEFFQLLPGVDEVVAQNIIRVRAGLDGVDGTEDDTPFQSLAMLSPAMVPGMVPELAVEMQRLRLATD